MDEKKLNKIKELIEQGKQEQKYLNLDTMRLIQKSNVDKRKPPPKYIDHNWHILSEEELFYEVLQALQPDKKIRYIKPDPKSTTPTTTNSKSTTKSKSTTTTTRPKSLRPSIPKNIRIEVWEQQHGKKCYIGYCFCCRQNLEFNDFEAGHIKPYFHGGADQVDNLRPVCKSCNISMTTLHMYEYMIRYNKAGRKDLAIDRSYIFFNGLVHSCNEAITKLEKMLQNGKITQTKAEKYRNSVQSSRSDIDQRLAVLEEIRKL